MRKIVLCWTLIITACGVPPRAPAPPTPVVITIALTPALEPMVETLHACAKSQDNYVLTVKVAPVHPQDNRSTDVSIRLGDIPGDNFPISLGDESIQLITNIVNPVTNLSLSDIQGIYTGKIANWDEVGGLQEPIQVWVYPDGDDVRSIFDSAIIPDQDLTNLARLAPDPQDMLEAVAGSPQAIGYVPQSWITRNGSTDAIKPLGIDRSLVDKLRQPILALTLAEPKDPLRGLLACLQSSRR